MTDKIQLNIESKELNSMMKECISKKLTSVVDCAISHESLSTMLSNTYRTMDLSGSLKIELERQIEYCMGDVVRNFMQQTDFQAKINSSLVEYIDSDEGKELLKNIAIKCIKN